jgi:predicted CopG family antitoxin
MHAHACYNEVVRTTVEMKTEHRSALLALAARRGEKGFSNVLADAIEEYLDGERKRSQRRKELLSLAGSLSDQEAEALRAEVKAAREHWR